MDTVYVLAAQLPHVKQARSICTCPYVRVRCPLPSKYHIFNDGYSMYVSTWGPAGEVSIRSAHARMTTAAVVQINLFRSRILSAMFIFN